MYKKIIAILLMVMMNLNLGAMEISVQVLNKSYNLTSTENDLKIEASDLNLSLSKKECNQKIISNFHKMIEVLTNGLNKLPLKKTIKEKASIVVDKKKFIVDAQSQTSADFMNLPNLVLEAKFKEKFACEASR